MQKMRTPQKHPVFLSERKDGSDSLASAKRIPCTVSDNLPGIVLAQEAPRGPEGMSLPACMFSCFRAEPTVVLQFGSQARRTRCSLEFATAPATSVTGWQSLH